MINNVIFFAILHYLFHYYYIMHVFQELVFLPLVHHSQAYCTLLNKNISFNFWTCNITLKIGYSRYKRGTPKNSQCLWITISFKWETPATKYHIYTITNFMASILSGKLLHSDFSFQSLQKSYRTILFKNNLLNVTDMYILELGVFINVKIFHK